MCFEIGFQFAQLTFSLLGFLKRSGALYYATNSPRELLENKENLARGGVGPKDANALNCELVKMFYWFRKVN